MSESASDMVMEMQRYISAESFEDLMAQPQYAARHIDLVEGELIEMPKPTEGHGETVGWIYFRILEYARRFDLGRAVVGDTGFILQRGSDGRDTVRGLDIAFLSKSKAPDPLQFTRTSNIPDLAVEVVSPSNTAADIDLKVTQLLDAGCSLVWVVYPETRHVIEHTADRILRFSEDETLDGGDVLPGFTVRVGEIFPS